MDGLIEKWKKTASSASRYSEQKLKVKQLSSSSESSQERKVNQKSSPQPVANSTKSLKVSHQSSGKKSQPSLPNSGTKKQYQKPTTFTQLLDFSTSQLQQLFRSNILPSQLNEQIKTQLVEFAENLQALGSQGYAAAQVEELQMKLSQAEQQIYTLRKNPKEDASKKIIAELEEKLLDSEKQRIKLKQQKESMQIQIEKISETLGKYQISQELIHSMKQENLQLRKNNDALLQQIQLISTQNQEQQVIWNQQVEDLIKMMDILKKQVI